MRYAALIVTAALAVLPPGAHAWRSVVGSAGSLDENCAGLYSFSGPNVSLKSGAGGICTLRYHMRNCEYVAGYQSCEGPTLPWIQVGVTFVDNGPAARVRVRVQQFSHVTHQTTTVGSMDSDDFTPSPTWQSHSTKYCSEMRFDSNSYWVEVDLMRGARSGKPALQSMSTYWSSCDGDMTPQP